MAYSIILSYSFLSWALKEATKAWLSMVHCFMINGWLLHDWQWSMIGHHLLFHFHLKIMPPQFTYYCFLLVHLSGNGAKIPWWLIVVCGGDCCFLILYLFLISSRCHHFCCGCLFSLGRCRFNKTTCGEYCCKESMSKTDGSIILHDADGIGRDNRAEEGRREQSGRERY